MTIHIIVLRLYYVLNYYFNVWLIFLWIRNCTAFSFNSIILPVEIYLKIYVIMKQRCSTYFNDYRTVESIKEYYMLNNNFISLIFNKYSKTISILMIFPDSLFDSNLLLKCLQTLQFHEISAKLMQFQYLLHVGVTSLE